MTKLHGPSSGALIRGLARLFEHGTSGGLTEGELVRRFVAEGDETAFTILVARHGPMVLGVCRQLLHDPHDVDDAFQATFLVMVRKASRLRRADLLGNWLYGVATRVAARSRSHSARRNARLAVGYDVGAVPSDASAVGDHAGSPDLDIQPPLHQEVSRLPEKYRLPIVLCYFEGLTHEQAAASLGWPVGSVKGRLCRARELLRRRLTRRGLTLSAAALIVQLEIPDARGAIPAYLEKAALAAAQGCGTRAAASVAATSAASASITNLVDGVLYTMFMSQLKSLALPLFLVSGTVATGVFVGAAQLAPGAARGQIADAQAASPDQTAQRAFGTAGKSAQPKVGASADSLTPGAEEQRRHEQETFDKLLSDLPNLGLEEIDRLGQWSHLTAQADLAVALKSDDRLAALEAHRDRMKKLHQTTLRIPHSDKDQPAKADAARTKLEEAERMIEREKRGEGMGSMMAQMRGMMGNQMRGMVGASMAPPRMRAMGQSSAGARAAADEPEASAGKGARKNDSSPSGESGKSAGGSGDTRPAGAGSDATAVARGTSPGAEPAMMGGMGRMMMGRMSPAAMNRQLRLANAGLEGELEGGEADPQSQAVLKKLAEPIAMSFEGGTSLEDMLKHIKQATTDPKYSGLPIYVDPQGLKDAGVAIDATVTMDLEGVPLKTTLRLLLKQLGLAYCVRDGVLIISSVAGINEELMEQERERQGKNPDPSAAGTQ